jgi:hypothetical protein
VLRPSGELFFAKDACGQVETGDLGHPFAISCVNCLSLRCPVQSFEVAVTTIQLCWRAQMPNLILSSPGISTTVLDY